MNQNADLNLVTTMMQTFAQTGSVEQALDEALPVLLDTVKAEAGSLFLHQADKGNLRCAVCVGPVDVTGLEAPVKGSLVGSVWSSGEAKLIADVRDIEDGHYRGADIQSGFQTESTITVPVAFGDTIHGALQAINKKPSAYNNDTSFNLQDMERLNVTASMLGLALTNVKLTDQAVQNRLMARDVDQARSTQSMMLPAPDEDDHIAGLVLPARQLSGDFFSHLKSDDGLLFCLGDVSGKGISAALIMARTATLFDYFARQLRTPDAISRAVNDALIAAGTQGHFVTFVCGSLDQRTGKVTLVNCGHLPLLHLQKDSATREIAASCPPLGILPSGDLTLEVEHITLGGGSLFIYTDGVSEGRLKSDGGHGDDHDDELGLQRLITLLEGGLELGSTAQVERVEAMFTSGYLQTHDDASLLIISGQFGDVKKTTS